MSRPHAILVGAGPGMGLALARRFAHGGCRISMLARRQESLDHFVAAVKTRRGSAAGFVADASDYDSLHSAIELARAEHGPVDVLIYNAAARVLAPIVDVEPADLEQTLRVNAGGALAAVQAVLPDMRERGSGTILFTGGGLALRPLADFGALAMGKAAQRSLAQTLSLELQGTGIYTGTVLIAGYVQKRTAFDPDRIAEEFWRLHAERPAESEVIFRG